MKRSNTFIWLAHTAVSLTTAHPTFQGVTLNKNNDLLSAYDYVIVGAGASGLTVANRLSENASKKIPSGFGVFSNANTCFRNDCSHYRGWPVVSEQN